MCRTNSKFKVKVHGRRMSSMPSAVASSRQSPLGACVHCWWPLTNETELRQKLPLARLNVALKCLVRPPVRAFLVYCCVKCPCSDFVRDSVNLIGTS